MKDLYIITNASQEATEQFFGGNCVENNTAGETTSSANNKQSEESLTSAQNKEIMAKEIISANASQGGAEEQFFGENCGKGNATPKAEGTGSAEVKTYIKKGGDNVG